MLSAQKQIGLLEFGVIPPRTVILVVAVIIAALPLFGPIRAHDSDAHAHADLKNCVSVTLDGNGLSGTHFSITNNCDVGAHVSWCWENPDLSYGCLNSSAVLERTSGHRYPVLRPDETVSWHQALTKTNSRYWYSACVARWHEYEEVYHAIDHCDLHVSWPPMSILQGWGEHMCQLAGTLLPVNPGKSSRKTHGSSPSVAVDPCRAVETRLDHGGSRSILPH